MPKAIAVFVWLVLAVATAWREGTIGAFLAVALGFVAGASAHAMGVDGRRDDELPKGHE